MNLLIGDQANRDWTCRKYWKGNCGWNTDVGMQPGCGRNDGKRLTNCKQQGTQDGGGGN